MKHVILRIYLSEKDSYRGKAAYHAVIEFFKKAGIAGATVHHCIEGYGVDHVIHTANVLRLGCRPAHNSAGSRRGGIKSGQ